MFNKIVILLLLITCCLLAANMVQVHRVGQRVEAVSQGMRDVAWSLATLSMTLGDTLDAIRQGTDSLGRSMKEVEARDHLAAFDLCLARSEIHRLGSILAPGSYQEPPAACIPALPDLELSLP